MWIPEGSEQFPDQVTRDIEHAIGEKSLTFGEPPYPSFEAFYGVLQGVAQSFFVKVVSERDNFAFQETLTQADHAQLLARDFPSYPVPAIHAQGVTKSEDEDYAWILYDFIPGVSARKQLQDPTQITKTLTLLAKLARATAPPINSLPTPQFELPDIGNKLRCELSENWPAVLSSPELIAKIQPDTQALIKEHSVALVAAERRISPYLTSVHLALQDPGLRQVLIDPDSTSVIQLDAQLALGPPWLNLSCLMEEAREIVTPTDSGAVDPMIDQSLADMELSPTIYDDFLIATAGYVAHHGAGFDGDFRFYLADDSPKELLERVVHRRTARTHHRSPPASATPNRSADGAQLPGWAPDLPGKQLHS